MSLRFWRLVLALAIGLLIFVGTQLRSAPVDVYPEFTPPAVQIQTEALGLSAAEVEQFITIPLEQDLLNGVPWLDHMHSESMPGLSVIDLNFQPGTNIYSARQLVNERMTQAHALPNVGSPPLMIQPEASASRVAMIQLTSRQVSYLQMSILARWKIRPRLMGVPGVANVSIYGQRDRQLQVQVDPAEMRARKVTLTQVIETAGNALWVSPLTFVEASTPGTGGFVESPNQRLSVQHISPIYTPRQLAQVPIQGKPGVTLSDVAHVVEGHQQPLIGDAVATGAPRGSHSLFLVVDKFPGVNTVQVTRDVDAALADMKPALRGITINPGVYRPATYIQTATRNAGVIGAVALAVLVAVMLLVSWSWRRALIMLAVVPVALAVAATVLYVAGTTFTTMTLLGLAAATALIVDDVVADVDGMRVRPSGRDGAPEPGQPGQQEQARGPEPGGDNVIAAFAASRAPLMYATLAILIALLPFLVLSSLTTAFSRPLVLTFALAMLSSLLVAFTLTPALAYLLLRGDAGRREGPFAAAVRRGYGSGPVRWLLHPGPAWVLAGVLALVAIAVVPQIGGRSLLPDLQDRSLLVQVRAVPSIALPEMDRVTAAMSGQLRRVPGVTQVGAHVGRAVTSDQLVGAGSAEIWLTVAPGADYGSTREAVEAVIRGYPGLRTRLGTYPGERVAQVAGAGTSGDLTVRVYGPDLVTLQRKAQQIRSVLRGVPGLANPEVVPVPREPAVNVSVNIAAAQKFGLAPGDIRRDATTMTSGLIVGSLYQASKIFDVTVWGPPGIHGNLTDFGNLPIGTPSGHTVPLKDVASVTVRPEPVAITHDNVQRDVAVTANVTGDPGAVEAAVRARVEAMPMPYTYHAEVFSTAAARQSQLFEVLIYAGIVLIAAYLLLQAAAASWRRAALLLLSVPLSAVGAVAAAPLAGGLWSAPALTGLFAVCALGLRSATLSGYRVRQLTRAGEVAGRAAAAQVARDRVVPVLQSVLVIAGAMLPPAVTGGAGLEFLHPLAVTVLGGLVSLAVVQAIVVPGLLQATEPSVAQPAAQPEPSS